MTIQEAIREVNQRPELVLDRLTKSHGGQFVCPYCGSGSRGGRDSDGALTYYPQSRRFVCFACPGKEGFGQPGQDVAGALQIITGQSLRDVLTAAGYHIGVSAADAFTENAQRTQSHGSGAGGQTIPPQQTPPQNGAQTLTEQPADYTAYYAECARRLTDPAAVSYLQGRGISLATATAAGCGFDPAADPAGKGHPCPRIILPTSSSHYVGRSIDPNTPDNFKKLNPAGSSPCIFNEAILNSSTGAVFVVEGIFDALSIIEAGADSIALNSTSNAGKLLDRLRQRGTAATLILCLDNDKAGARALDTLKEGMRELNIDFRTADICNGHKDPNEALTADRAAFTAAVRRAASDRRDNVRDYITGELYSDIERFKASNNMKTGFENLDEKSGGLYAGLYVVAAISSLGKTTFCHQIADQLAAAGQDVLFFSLEQSKLELVSKSLSRETAKADIMNGVSAISIRRGYLPQIVLDAADRYALAIEDRLSIIEGNFGCDISFIGDYVRQYQRRTGKTPVLFVDYLQILQPGKDERGHTMSAKESTDLTITELKRLSRSLNMTIFVVSSVNRSNYMQPIGFESLKESGGIEYTADVIFGLQLQVLNDPLFSKAEKIKDKRIKINEAKAETPRKIELVCLKNRYGISSYSCYFYYYPEYDLFKPGRNEYEDTTPSSTPRAGANRL